MRKKIVDTKSAKLGGPTPVDTPDGAAISSTSSDETFLRRWSRRKRGSERISEEVDGDVIQPAADEAAGADEDVALAAERVPPRLTDVEALTVDSDFRPFLSSDVAGEVRKAALNKLFHSPAFNVVDGLDDYDEDFRSFELLGDILTADRKFEIQRKAERAREEAERLAMSDGPESVHDSDDSDTDDGSKADKEVEAIAAHAPAHLDQTHSAPGADHPHVQQPAHPIADPIAGDANLPTTDVADDADDRLT